MKKNLVLLLFSFLSISFILSQDNFDTWDYIFNGTCEPKQPRCLPYSKMSFSYIWDNYTEEQIISEANDWIKTQPNFNKKIHIDRSRAWFKKSLGVFLDEKANINDTIVSFHDNETYSSLLDFPHFKNMPYYEKDMEILKKINFNESDDSSILQAVMLLYHFYHFEDSPNKPDIRLFPRKPAVPLLLLSMYEVSLLDKDEAEKKVLEMRGYYINSFIKFHNKIVAANLTTDEFVHFFNRSNIHSDDWNYVFSLIFSYGISGSKEIDGKRVPTGFIAPIIRLTTHNKERDVNHKNVYNWQASKIANERELVFEVKEKLLKNDEIQIDSINRQYESWLNVGFLSKRADNCITINLVPKDIETTFKIPSYQCVKASDDYLINQIYLTGNLLNMEEKDLNKCKRILERENSLSDKRRMEILFNECKHPKWTNYNLFKGIIQEVDTRIQYYQLNIEKAENTGIRRVMDGASSDLVLEIRDYLKERLETCRAIMNIVKEFKKINRRLNSLTEVDRRKIKGILEEKMEKEEEAKIEQELRDEL